MDCHEEEGYGVYMMDGFSADTSFTTSFGYGPMAEIMAQTFFNATVNYFEEIMSQYDESLDIEEDEIVAPEWEDCWVKISHPEIKINGEYPNIMTEDSDIRGLQPLLEFMTKWGFKEEDAHVNQTQD